MESRLRQPVAPGRGEKLVALRLAAPFAHQQRVAKQRRDGALEARRPVVGQLRRELARRAPRVEEREHGERRRLGGDDLARQVVLERQPAVTPGDGQRAGAPDARLAPLRSTSPARATRAWRGAAHLSR